jgi:hypothetical protein
MLVMHTESNRWIDVVKSFYMTFDGIRCYCDIPELYLSSTSARMLVKYKQGDEEAYRLASQDGVHFTGAQQGRVHEIYSWDVGLIGRCMEMRRPDRRMVH